MRTVRAINENWYFSHDPSSLPGQIPKTAVPVTLPHTWNAVDGHDGHDIDKPADDWAAGDLAHKEMTHYDRGSYWYYRKFENETQHLPGGRLYVEIMAAGQQAAVYINGTKVTEHFGGYAAFRADVTDYLRKEGNNLLAVNVSNKHRSDVYPQHADFTFYGGLYRGVNLISVAGAHFDLDHFGGSGLQVSSKPGKDGSAEFHLTAYPVGVNEDIITIMSEDPKAHKNAMLQMKELVIQNYNHPCICFWGLSNEVLLGRTFPEELIPNHRELNALVKSLDPDRLTTLAHVAGTPEESDLHTITDVEAYNNYYGWYVGTIADNGPWLDGYHARHPERCLGLSEYGCEGIVTYHSAEPVCKDYTEDYQALYHEEMARVLDARPYIWGSFVWNMFDFGAAARNEGGVAGRNNKGLMTLDRKIKKDSYYIYKAYWNEEPMVHICGKRFVERPGETEIKVYSNQPEVTLFLNGEKVETRRAEKVFSFSVKLAEGMNSVRAEAGSVSDTAVLDRSYKKL